MQNAGLDELQARIKNARRNNLRHADDTTLMVESKEELKNLLMKVKEENGKSWLKTQMFKKLRSWHHFMANIWGKWKHWQILFSLAPKSLQMVTAAMKLKDACSWKKSYEQPRQHIKKQRHHFADKGSYSQNYDFSSDHIQM